MSPQNKKADYQLGHQGGKISSESWKRLAVRADRPLCWTGQQNWSSSTGLEEKTGPPARRLVRISPVVKDAHLALPTACWPGAYTLSREHFWFNSAHTLLRTKYSTLILTAVATCPDVKSYPETAHTVCLVLYGSRASVPNVKWCDNEQIMTEACLVKGSWADSLILWGLTFIQFHSDQRA